LKQLFEKKNVLVYTHIMLLNTWLQTVTTLPVSHVLFMRQKEHVNFAYSFGS